MKILFQAYGPDRGGGIANVAILVSAYARTFPDDFLTIICSRGSPLENLKENHRFSNCRLISLPNDRWKEARRFWLNYRGLSKMAQAETTDIIWSLNLGPYGRTGVTQILSLHNPHQIYPITATQSHPGGRLRVVVLRYFFRWSLYHSDGIVTQTPTMLKLVQTIKPPQSKAIVIPKAVESTQEVEFAALPPEIAKQFPDQSSRPFSFLYVASSIPHKNHKTIIFALEQLCLTGADARLFLTITEEEAIRIGGEVAFDLIRRGRLVPLGWVDKKYLRALYAACDACVMPSLLESLSSSHLEAMAWARPQIVADLPYAHELCGPAALYSNPTDVADWVQKMHLLMTDRMLQNHLTAAGLEQIRQYPESWAKVATMLRQFFMEVAESKSYV